MIKFNKIDCLSHIQNQVRDQIHGSYSSWCQDFLTLREVSAQTFNAIQAESEAYEFDIRVPGTDWKVIVVCDDNYVPNRAYAICVAYWGTDCVSHCTAEKKLIQ